MNAYRPSHLHNLIEIPKYYRKNEKNESFTLLKNFRSIQIEKFAVRVKEKISIF